MNLVRRLWPGFGRALPSVIFASPFLPRPVRHYPLRAVGVDVDKSARIESGVRIGSRMLAVGYGPSISQVLSSTTNSHGSAWADAAMWLVTHCWSQRLTTSGMRVDVQRR